MLRYSKIYFAFSGILIILSIGALFLWRLNLGIDFLGGSLLEAEFQDARPTNQEIKDKISDLNLGEIVIQPVGSGGIILRMKEVDEDTHQGILQKLQEWNFEEKRFDSIGPVIGKETQKKALISVALVVIMVLLFVAWAFRKVRQPISSWYYGVAAIIALFHDVLITVGVFSLLGRFSGIEVGIPFVAALLTILGYSVNDTIVVFDRIRENIIREAKKDFEELINQSIKQTLVRSLNVSLTTLFVLAVIFILGGETIKYFILTLIIGISIGTYSSIFLAPPLLTRWWRWRVRA